MWFFRFYQTPIIVSSISIYHFYTPLPSALFAHFDGGNIMPTVGIFIDKREAAVGMPIDMRPQTLYVDRFLRLLLVWQWKTVIVPDLQRIIDTISVFHLRRINFMVLKNEN